MKFTALLALVGFAVAGPQWKVAKTGDKTTHFSNIKITGDPRHDKSITLSGKVERNSYCKNCQEQLYAWIAYQGHEYKTAIEPTLISAGSRSASGYNFSVKVPTHPDPKARKIFAKYGIELQYDVQKANANFKNSFMKFKGDKSGYGLTVATWEAPCNGSWSSWSKCVNTTLIPGGHGTYKIYSHKNADDQNNCEIGDGEIRMKGCQMKRAIFEEDEFEAFFL